MTLLAALLLAPSPVTAADFFPLVPGTRRIYEEKSDAKLTFVDEVAEKPAFFDDRPAFGVVQKSSFNQVLSTTYYRVDGPTVFMVGTAEDRRAATPTVGGAVDLTKQAAKRSVLMQFKPAMPVFKYEGKETTWTYSEIPRFVVPGEVDVRQDETAIKGVAKPGRERTVLGRKVETIEVRVDVTLGVGTLTSAIVETSVYGRGIGLIECVRRTTSGKKSQETRTTLVGLEEAKAG